MYITLDGLAKFHYGGTKFELPSNILRYIEFEKTVVFLLDENGKKDKIVGVKFSQEGGINHFYIAWEFQIIDGLGDIHPITSFVRADYQGAEVVFCIGWAYDIGFYLNPNTGEIICKIPVKG